MLGCKFEVAEVVLMLKKLFMPVVFAALILAVSQSVYAANAVVSRRLAEQWCARCHNIEKAARFKLNPPSMPGTIWALQREDCESLVDYITSLEAN